MGPEIYHTRRKSITMILGPKGYYTSRKILMMILKNNRWIMMNPFHNKNKDNEKQYHYHTDSLHKDNEDNKNRFP